MDIDSVIELATLPMRQPILGEAMLRQFGPQLVLTILTHDLQVAASILAADACAALGAGETPRATEKYKEAAEHLEARLPDIRKQSEKHLVRFLAASQYYHGGMYHKARDVCRKIQANLLPENVRLLYPKFRADVAERAAPDYETEIRAKLRELWNRKEFHRILACLQAHPYALEPGRLAYLRAACCERLKDYHAAAHFFRGCYVSQDAIGVINSNEEDARMNSLLFGAA